MPVHRASSSSVRYLQLALVAFVATISGVAALDASSWNNFNETVLIDGKNSLVEFYAPWCGICKKMKGDWDKLEKHFADNDRIIIAKVDCATDGGKEVCEKAAVKAYPTVKYYRNGLPEEGKTCYARGFENLKGFTEKMLVAHIKPDL